MLKTKIDRLNYAKKIMIDNNVSNVQDIDKELSYLKTKESKPPKSLLDKHIKKYQKLCKGIITNIKLWGRNIKIRIYWEEDNYPSYNVLSFDEDKFEKNLFYNIDYLKDTMMGHIYDCDEFSNKVTESKEWLKFQEEIDNIIKESIDWEEKYTDFDWHKDILDKYYTPND